MKPLVTLAISLILTCRAVAGTTGAEAYLCIVDRATGFVFDSTSQRWVAANFNAGKRFIIKRVDQSLHSPTPGTKLPIPGAWAVWEFGNDKWPEYTCASEFTDAGVLWCSDVLDGRFAFNRGNSRFITGAMFGYIQAGMPAYADFAGKPMKEGADTPAMQIGMCSAL